MRNLNQLLDKIISVRSIQNIKILDRELFINCKSIKRYIKKHNVSSNVAAKLPAVIIGALVNKKYKIDISKHVQKPIAKNLEIKLNNIGIIGKHNGINVVGKCAEVNSANFLLLTRQVPLNQIKFTRAYRPRTSQEIETCQNCLTVFK